MAYKVDLHTHSALSYDGIMGVNEYKKILSEGTLDYVAVTDHNEIDNALKFQQEIGSQIIVGEEIKTIAGDLIGLFINKKIEKGVSLIEAAEQIKSQGGLVYIPHPFDIMRSGLKLNEIETIFDLVDIVEGFNARYIYPGGNQKAMNFALKNDFPVAFGSDSHSFQEVGKTFNLINSVPTVDNLLFQLKNAQYSKKYVSMWNYLNPKKNKLRKLLRISR